MAFDFYGAAVEDAVEAERTRCLELVQSIGVYLPDETEIIDVRDVVKAIGRGLNVDEMEAAMVKEGW